MHFISSWKHVFADVRAFNRRSSVLWAVWLCQDVLLLILWSFCVNKLILVFFFYHQIPPGHTVSVAADYRGRGAHSHRSDRSDAFGVAHIRCTSLIPSGPLRASSSIHDSKSRCRLLVIKWLFPAHFSYTMYFFYVIHFNQEPSWNNTSLLQCCLLWCMYRLFYVNCKHKFLVTIETDVMKDNKANLT